MTSHAHSLPPIDQRPWLTIEEVAAQLGMTKSTAQNAVYAEEFPVPTEKLGRRRVVMKEVLNAYWELRAREGIQKLTGKNQPKGDSSTSA